MSAALKQAAQLKIQVNVVKGPHAGQTFSFAKPIITIGRGPENDIVLLNDPLVSRAHARINLVKSEFELVNLSEKNAMLIHGETTKKGILINDSLFQVGESEMKFQYDLGSAVVSVPTQPQPPPPPVAPAKPLSLVKTPAARAQAPATSPRSNQAPAVKPRPAQAMAPRPNGPPQQHYPQGYRPQPGLPHPQMAQGPHPGFHPGMSAAAPAPQGKKGFFYLIIGIVVLAGGYFYMMPNAKGKAAKAKPIIKYEDEVAMSLSSQKEADLKKKLEEDKKAKDSPTVQRAEENFMKGMRDFQLGNYARAQDFFQVVLNLQPDHALARRHLYLSKVRFDEIVQQKLVLGESYYQKHNYDMCVSMYQQVINMLQGKNSDQKFQLAQRMIEKCQLAQEGIR